jgi:hypothetical protein
LPTNGWCGNRAPRAASEPAAQLIDAATARSSPDSGTPTSRAPSTSIAAPAKPKARPIATRSWNGRRATKRSHTAIQRGTTAKISATVPDGTVRSASTTDPFPPAIRRAPTTNAAHHCGRPTGSPAASPRRIVRASSTPPAITNRVPAATSGGRVSFEIRIARYVVLQIA